MIVGMGVDVVDIARARHLLNRFQQRVLDRLCTPDEAAYVREHADGAHRLAVRLAAKEAAFKALAGGPEARSIGWREIEVTPAEGGPPGLRFHGRAQARAAQLGVNRAWISLSHGDGTAIAVVLLEA